MCIIIGASKPLMGLETTYLCPSILPTERSTQYVVSDTLRTLLAKKQKGYTIASANLWSS